MHLSYSRETTAMVNKVVIVTGGFDPIHSGHIAYIHAAAKLGDYLLVGLNSDIWLRNKKGQEFMPWQERAHVLNAMQVVDEVISYVDIEGHSCEAIEYALSQFPDAEVIFANGGDRTDKNILEMDRLWPERVSFVFGVGGNDKLNSSSWILEKWRHQRTDRIWGHYDVLAEYAGCKLKELVVNPHSHLSYQRHDKRSELWFVRQGSGKVLVNATEDRDKDQEMLLLPHVFVRIDQGHWHQLINTGDMPLHIIEIQYGTACLEEDIERRT
jgi:cytidyltransferase-like protein